MSGIFAAIHQEPVTNNLIKGLRALSNQTQECSGISIIQQGKIFRRRASDTIKNLASNLEKSPISGHIGIAYIQPPRDIERQHPYAPAQLDVVQSGTISNFKMLQIKLQQVGYFFNENSDENIVSQLISYYLDKRLGHKHAILCALNDIEGCYAVAIVFNDDPNTLYAARSGKPLTIGSSQQGFYLSSSEHALIGRSNNIFHMEDGDFACVRLSGIELSNGDFQINTGDMPTINRSIRSTTGDHSDYIMLKEIYQQAGTINATSFEFINPCINKAEFPDLPFDLKHIKSLSIVGSGSSYFAGMIAQYWFARLAKRPVNVEFSSKRRNRYAAVVNGETALFISKSGESADTLAALQLTKSQGTPCFSLTNSPNSRLAREADYMMHTQAGAEMGNTSTKTFTAQLTMLLGLTLAVASADKTLKLSEEQQILNDLATLPLSLKSFIDTNTASIKTIAQSLQASHRILYLGRGVAYPLALEGAFMLKEVSGKSVQALSARCLEEGSTDAIKPNLATIVIAPPGERFAKTLSNLKEASRRGAKITLISNRDGIELAKDHIVNAITMPDINKILQPLLYSIPLQLLAYYIAISPACESHYSQEKSQPIAIK